MQSDHKCSELVLIGGGHSHVQVLKSLAMDPVAGLRTTVISRDVMTPYSGMLPGYVAGHYDWRDIHIDLAPLAAAAGARLIEDQVEGLDPEAQRIMTAGRPPIRYDLLSINSGSAPALDHIVDADRFGIPVKPINQFVPKWQALLQRLREFEGERFRLAIVGGGAGGVELALAIRYRLEVVEQIGAVEILLISAADRLLLGHNDGVRERMRKLLSDRRLDVHLSARVTSVRAGLLETDVDGSIPVDEVLWVTQAAPQAWPAAAGLAVDESGFVLVNDKLQSVSHPNIFAAGDIATLENDPRPKAGVFAVRQAPVLAENLKRAATEQPLRAYKPQTQFLALISTGGRHAIASRGDLAAQGWWVWRWKNWLDRRFMERFVVKEMPNVKPRRHIEAMRADQRHDGRCGGSGAKLGADLLGRVLERIGVTSAPEDAAVLRPVVNGLELQTIDGFRAMLDDPYTVGRIAAEHAQNDVFAMGGLPRTAMAWVTVPFAAEALMEEDLYQVMCGAKDVFEKSGADIVGGHSGEGPELAVGFALSGTVHEDDVWNNHRIAIDDALILTKPIGTGVLLAAHGRARCRADWLKAALESMQHSNRAAMAMLRDAGVRACTDITGFGIVGHTVELARAAKLCVEIYPARVPCLMGAAEMMEDGIVSTLQESNERVLADVDAGSFDARHTQVRLLFDPQTSGGLVAAVRPQQAMACVAALREAGFAHANVIGRVVERRDDGLLCALAEE
jgi:selenide,water dikinase